MIIFFFVVALALGYTVTESVRGALVFGLTYATLSVMYHLYRRWRHG
jgi:hypothetical protein